MHFSFVLHLGTQLGINIHARTISQINTSLHDGDGNLDDDRFNQAFEKYATRDLSRNTITVDELFRMNNANGQLFTFS